MIDFWRRNKELKRAIEVLEADNARKDASIDRLISEKSRFKTANDELHRRVED